MNPGTSFDQRSLDALRVDEPAIADAVARVEVGAEDRSLRPRRLLSAVRCLDLTSLTGEETEVDVRSLCDSARRPLAGWRDLHVAAVCVLPALAPLAARALSETPVAVAAAAGGFPIGLTPISRRVDDVRSAVEAGACEIDLVIDRDLARAGRWEELYGELRALRAACGAALMKVILAAGDLGSLQRVARAGRVAMMAGADFVKTSTGRERVNATLPVGVVLAQTARSYEEETGISGGRCQEPARSLPVDHASRIRAGGRRCRSRPIPAGRLVPAFGVGAGARVGGEQGGWTSCLKTPKHHRTARTCPRRSFGCATQRPTRWAWRTTPTMSFGASRPGQTTCAASA